MSGTNRMPSMWKLWITLTKRSKEANPMPKLLPPIHPGEILREDLLKPLNLSVNQFAKALAVDTTRLNEIVHGRRSITADTALRLSRYLGTSAKFWLNLQSDYDLRVAQQTKLKEIERTVQPRPITWRADLAEARAEWKRRYSKRNETP